MCEVFLNFLQVNLLQTNYYFQVFFHITFLFILCKNCHRLEHYYLDNPEERPDSSLDNEMNNLDIVDDMGVEESKEEF